MNNTVDKIKCGQIFILSDDIFSLVCEFCGKEYRKLDDFVVHITNHFPETPTIIKQENAIKQEVIIKHEHTVSQEEIKQDIANRKYIVKQEDSINQEESINQEDSVKQYVISCDSEDESVPPVMPEMKLQQDEDDSQSNSADSLNEVWELISVEEESSEDTEQNEEMPTIRVREFQSTSSHENDENITYREQTVNPVTSHPPARLRKETIIDLTEENQTIYEKSRKITRFECKICALVFFSKCAFQDHINVHTGNRPHQCKLCPVKFAQETSLTMHIKIQHKKPHKKLHRCSECGKSFNKQCKLDYHVRERHLPDNDPRRYFPCTLCNVKFDRLHKLTAHRSLMHNQKSVFTCDYCKRQFNSRSIIELHMQIHSGINNYNCKHCGTKFSEIAPKLRHELNCTVEAC